VSPCIRTLLEDNLSPELLTKILEHLRVNNALVDEMLAQSLDNLHLLFRGEASNSGLDDATNRGLVDGDETRHSQFWNTNHVRVHFLTFGSTCMQRNP
jgi:hypothetical protein